MATLHLTSNELNNFDNEIFYCINKLNVLEKRQQYRHSGNAGEILAGTMYLTEGQFNIWWPNFGRQEVWQMSTKATVIDIAQP